MYYNLDNELNKIHCKINYKNKIYSNSNYN